MGDYLETVEMDGKIIERPKRISELPREVPIDGRGRAVPYSKLAAEPRTAQDTLTTGTMRTA